MARRIVPTSGLVLVLFLLSWNTTDKVVQSTLFTADDEVGTIFSDQQDTIKLRDAVTKATPATPTSILNVIIRILSSPLTARLAVEVGSLGKKQLFSFAIKHGMGKILGNSAENGKNGKLVASLDRILGEQKELEKEIKYLQQDMLKLNLAVSYAISEKVIHRSLTLWNRYSSNKSDNQHLRAEFLKEAAKIPKHVDYIMDGMLRSQALSENILEALRNINQCHGRKLNEKILILMNIVMTGVEVYKQSLQMENPNQNVLETFGESEFAKSLTQSVDEVTKKLDDMVEQCRMDERAVGKEMRDIIEKNSKRLKSNEDLAKAVRHFLEDKYDTKKWMVTMYSENHIKSGDIKSVQSGGFHSVSANGFFVLAISNGINNNQSLMNDPSNNDGTFLSPKQRSFLDRFKIPYNLEMERDTLLRVKRSTNSSDVKVIHDYLGRYLTPLRTDQRFDVEFLVYNYEDCQGKVAPFNRINVYSKGFEYFELRHTSCPGNSTLPTYRTTVVIVVPKRSSPSWNSTLSVPAHQHSTSSDNLKCFPSNRGRMLRNEFSQGYLSERGNSINGDANVVVDRHWSNTLGQRWRFINNTLRNDHENCLTVGGSMLGIFSPLLSSARCDPGSSSQMWIRHGLQIVQHGDRSSMYCVGVDVTREASFGRLLLQPVLGECSTNPRYLWYHWGTDCEDELVIHGTPSSSNGQHLRNELSKRFLGTEEDEVKHGPWMNLPGQRWRFVDGQLMNDGGVCLIIGDDRSLLQKDCREARKLPKHSNWKYNERTRQIVSDGGNGFCLTANEINGVPGIMGNVINVLRPVLSYIPAAVVDGISFKGVRLEERVHIDDCKDVPEQKWSSCFYPI